MTNWHRTHTCGELNASHIGERASLSGWIQRSRNLGGLIFADLRDRFGVTQLIFDPKKHPEAHALAETLRQEFVVTAKGEVSARAEGMANPNMKTGEIELHVESLEILSKAETPPFELSETVNEELRLQYRYLDMRRGAVAERLAARHHALLAARNYLSAHGFLEIQTPILAKSTPEGARDYLVPSRIYPGSFYALPQSPQLFKQLLMIGGMDRYFQVALCFRDEDLRADRQPEFTQIDLEMSFSDPETLFPLIEGLVTEMFRTYLKREFSPYFRRVSYEECLEHYGTDKPDMRFGMRLFRLDEPARRGSFSAFHECLESGGCIKGLCVPEGAHFSRKQLEGCSEFAARLGIKGLSWAKVEAEGRLQSGISKFFNEELQAELVRLFSAKPGDLLFFAAEREELVNRSLDHLRRKLASDLNLINPDQYEFLWVTDFPLFLWNEEERRIESSHHPFTSPLFEDIPLLESDPLKVRSSSYDLVVNGYEIGSGSQRIHDSSLQKKIFRTLRLDEEEIERKFGFFLEALSYGTPPHLGIALGVERLIMLLTKTDNIRDVIAFPKTKKASDLMMAAPSPVAEEQLQELRLALMRNRDE